MRVRHIGTEVMADLTVYSFEAVDIDDQVHANLWVEDRKDYGSFNVELMPISGIKNGPVERARFLMDHLAHINWELIKAMGLT